MFRDGDISNCKPLIPLFMPSILNQANVGAVSKPESIGGVKDASSSTTPNTLQSIAAILRLLSSFHAKFVKKCRASSEKILSP